MGVGSEATRSDNVIGRQHILERSESSADPVEKNKRAAGGALKSIYQALSCYLSCMSTPPPVALTSTPFCVAEMRTITPA